MIWLYVFFFLARDFNTFDAAVNGSLKKMFLESCKWGTLLRCFRRRTPVSQVPVQCQTMSDLVLTGSASVPAVFLLLVFICLWLTSVSIFGAGAWGAEGLELAELWTHKKNTRESGILHGRLMVSQLKGWCVAKSLWLSVLSVPILTMPALSVAFWQMSLLVIRMKRGVSMAVTWHVLINAPPQAWSFTGPYRHH